MVELFPPETSNLFQILSRACTRGIPAFPTFTKNFHQLLPKISITKISQNLQKLPKPNPIKTSKPHQIFPQRHSPICSPKMVELIPPTLHYPQPHKTSHGPFYGLSGLYPSAPTQTSGGTLSSIFSCLLHPLESPTFNSISSLDL